MNRPLRAASHGAARLRAWAETSLAARLLAIGAGLVVLAVLGSALAPSSALAGGGPPPSPWEASLPAAPDPATWADAQAPVPCVEAADSTHGPVHATAASHAGPRATEEDPVILNLATVDDLRRLPGIGEKRAQAILALRARLGRFRQLEDLLKVKGIGRTTLRRLRPIVRLEPAAVGDGGA